uniref:Uncharacterized protein n=1 Tax=Romanomermis culicivorax TaxID=13658 RepID=A0A915I790_ROMCU
MAAKTSVVNASGVICFEATSPNNFTLTAGFVELHSSKESTRKSSCSKCRHKKSHHNSLTCNLVDKLLQHKVMKYLKKLPRSFVSVAVFSFEVPVIENEDEEPSFTKEESVFCGRTEKDLILTSGS